MREEKHMRENLSLDNIKELIGEVMDDSKIAERMSDDADLFLDVGMDSLTMINFVLRVEEEFDIEIDFDDFDMGKLCSLKDFFEYLCNL